jgi:F-type H+-transporting ATPase subunit b
MPQFNATLVFVLISFIIFMVLMKAIYFDPILKIKDERERKLIDDREAAQRFAEEFDRIHAEYETGVKQARKEAHQVIQEIRQAAKTEAQQALTDARTNAHAETERQMAELAQWREETYRQLEAERDTLTRTIIGKVTASNRVGMASGG